MAKISLKDLKPFAREAKTAVAGFPLVGHLALKSGFGLWKLHKIGYKFNQLFCSLFVLIFSIASPIWDHTWTNMYDIKLSISS